MRITLDESLQYLAFGCVSLMFLPSIPALPLVYGLLPVAVIIVFHHSAMVFKAALITLGVVWGISCAQRVLEPLQYPINHAANYTGEVISVALDSVSLQEKVVFRIAAINGTSVRHRFDTTLFWDSVHNPFCSGQRWSLVANLRPVHGRLNQGGYDAQRNSVSHHIVLQGAPTAYEKLSHECSWRQKMISQTLSVVPDTPAKSIIIALAFGERALLTDSQNSLFRMSGLSHLLAISGLHIALAAMLGWYGARTLQWCFPLRWIHPYFPLFMMVSVGWVYVWLAGANPPAVRVGVAMVIIAGYRCFGRFISPRKSLFSVVCLMVVCEPLLLLSDSFWLSVIAVTSLLFWYWFAPLPARFTIAKRYIGLRLLHLQLGIALCLMPVQIYLFHGVSGGALWANFIAVPLVTYLVVPMILLGLATLWGADPFDAWHVAGFLLDRMQWVLAHLPTLWVDMSERDVWISLSVLMLFIAVRSFSKRGLLLWGLVQISVFLAFVSMQKTSDDEWRVHMFDVGHGLSIAIERQGRALLYDTGNKWEGGDVASSEIIPYLRWHGLALDGIIISHRDSDHSGGRASLQQAFPSAWVRSPDFKDFACYIGSRWQWQGINFTVLWPPRAVSEPKNNDSCVILVERRGRKLLLTGDIEKETEVKIVQRWRERLVADVLQVPHHGSNTSSSSLLLRTIKPENALSSSARYSPWHFPSPKVVERYRGQQVKWHDTAHSGEVIMTVKPSGWRISELKTQLNPRWYHGWFGVRGHNE